MNKSKLPYSRRSYKPIPLALQAISTQTLKHMQTWATNAQDYTEENYTLRCISVMAMLASRKDGFLSMSDKQLDKYRNNIRPGYGWNKTTQQYYKIEKVK
jgi:hypothetical protein